MSGWAAGWNRDCVQWFGDYAELMIRTFGGQIPLWATVNEPIATYVGYALGGFAPGRKLEVGRQANHNLSLSHGEAVRRFREIAPKDAKGRNCDRYGTIGRSARTMPKDHALPSVKMKRLTARI